MVRQMGINGGIMTVNKSPVTLVKPESETPGGTYFLSSLDQAIPFPMRTIYTYKTSIETVADVLKQALAKVLVHYYPLAGSLAINAEGLFIVDCTNKSVPFVEAEADCDIDSLGDLRVPNEDTTNKLTYLDTAAQTILDLPLLTAQVTRFKCGGFSLGVAINHAIGDGVSGMNFINSWGEVARGVPISAVPFHDRTILRARVPPQIKYPYYDAEYVEISDVSEMESLYQNDANISRKFTFDSEKLATIKNKAMEDGCLSNCSAFSALAGLVWRARSKALNMKPHQLTKLQIMVDLRSKLKETLPSAYFGNAVTTTCCLSSAGELVDQPLGQTVDQIRKACQLVNEDYIRSKIDYIHVHRPHLSSVGTLVISSWARLPYGCSNFGWGDPVQFGCADLARALCVFLPEGEEGNHKKSGITVVMSLPVTAMNTFDQLIAQI